MGKIISSESNKTIVERNIQSYIQQNTVVYPFLSSTPPTFVSYYSQSYELSTTDINLGGVVELIGNESSLRFSRIENFPLYKFSGIDVQSVYDEILGINANDSIQGETIILPRTIKPVENDFFILSYLDAEFVFRVTQVSVDKIEGHTFYKLNFILDVSANQDLEDNVARELSFNIEDTGSDVKSIIESSLNLLIKEMNSIAEIIKDNYWKLFYNKSASYLILKHFQPEVGNILEQNLNIFVKKNNLMDSLDYLNSRVLTFPIDYEYLNYFYTLSIFNFVENKKFVNNLPDFSSTMLQFSLILSKPFSKSDPLFSEFAIKKYNRVFYVPNHEPGGIRFSSDNFFNTLVNNQPNLSLTPLESLVVDFIKEDLGSANIDKVYLQNFVDRINEDSFFQDASKAYLLIPILIYKIRVLNNKIKKTNK